MLTRNYNMFNRNTKILNCAYLQECLIFLFGISCSYIYQDLAETIAISFLHSSTHLDQMSTELEALYFSLLSTHKLIIRRIIHCLVKAKISMIDSMPNIDKIQIIVIDSMPSIDKIQIIVIDLIPNIDKIQIIVIDSIPNIDKIQIIVIDSIPNLDKIRIKKITLIKFKNEHKTDKDPYV